MLKLLATLFLLAPAPQVQFEALECIDNDAVTNKRWVVPQILGSRRGRRTPPRELLSELRRSARIPGNLTQEPETVWNGYQWKQGDGDLVWENMNLDTDWLWMSNLFSNGNQGWAKRPGKWVWRNLYVEPQQNPYNASMKWALRAYNMPDCTFEDCDFYAIPKSHALYVSNYENTLVDGCTFVRAGSQGVQFAHREGPNGPNNRPYDSKPTHILRNSHFIDCGETGRANSFNATYFNPGSSEFPGTLLIENCSFVAQFEQPQGYYNDRSTGALVVTPHDWNPVLTENFMERVEIRNCLFDFTAGDRAMIHIRSTDEVLFEDCAFISRDHRYPTIDIDNVDKWSGDTKTKYITIRNCAARNTTLRIFPRNADHWTDAVYHDLNTLGMEVIIDGETGQIISSGYYN